MTPTDLAIVALIDLALMQDGYTPLADVERQREVVRAAREAMVASPPTPIRHPHRRRTPERERFLRAVWVLRIPAAMVLEEVNKLSGDLPFEMASLKGWVIDLKLRRPAGYQGHSAARQFDPWPEGFGLVSAGPAPTTEATPVQRGMPGVALPPIGRTWGAIKTLALADGRELRGLDDLLPYNRSRIARGDAPLAVQKAGRL
jgi:hypothetical protein